MSQPTVGEQRPVGYCSDFVGSTELGIQHSVEAIQKLSALNTGFRKFMQK
jgi:hypothetical protein